jgi:hypothetical protein
MGIHRECPASVHVNQQVHLDLLPIRLTPPRKGRLFCRMAERNESSVAAFRSRPRSLRDEVDGLPLCGGGAVAERSKAILQLAEGTRLTKGEALCGIDP